MGLKHLWDLVFNRKKFKKPATITLQNVVGFLQGNARALAMHTNIKWLQLPEHQEEQSYWRLSQIQEKSPECIKEGRCKECGCSIDEKVLEDRGCEGGCYPPMMNNIVWHFYKKDNNIKVRTK